jgi:hypothetical protein
VTNFKNICLYLSNKFTPFIKFQCFQPLWLLVLPSLMPISAIGKYEDDIMLIPYLKVGNKAHRPQVFLFCFIFCFLVFFFWDKVSLHSWDWSPPRDPLASSSQVLGCTRHVPPHPARPVVFNSGWIIELLVPILLSQSRAGLGYQNF